VTRVVLDLETCSVLDLTKSGPDAYAQHPSTRITVLAYAIDDAPVTVWTGRDEALLQVFAAAVRAGAVVVAHNFAFEYALYQHKLVPSGWPPVPLSQWSCTMARCYAAGLPGALEAAAPAAGLSIAKDSSARGLMLRMARPRGLNPVTDEPIWWDQTDPDKLKQLTDYCVRDVEVERELDRVVPELTAFERRVFEADFRLNRRGLRIDQALVAKMIGLTRAEHVRVNERLSQATDGFVTTGNQVARITEWLGTTQRVSLDQLTREVVTKVLTQPGLPDPARIVLEGRLDASRASTAKLQVMQAGVSSDGRLRNAFQYYGAARTGRWAGRRVQPQNFFRGTIKRVDQAIDLVESGCDAEGLDILFEDRPMGVIASCLRGTIQAAPGHVLISVDLAQIEARVVAWLAGQTDILGVFAAGEDVYTYTAAKIGSKSRHLGKVLVLACGFGMGAERFLLTALSSGLSMTLAEAKASVDAWRDASPHIVDYWYRAYETACSVVSMPPGRSLRVGRMLYRRTGHTLEVELPSGRALVYREPAMQVYPDTGRETLSYMGGRTAAGGGMWTRLWSWPGKLTENVVQAVARDVMAEALVRMDEKGIPIIATIHDELVAEVPEDQGQATLDWMLWAMRQRPAWAKDLPVGAAGWTGTRYKKG
jgi:DNA polymerase